MPLNFPILEKGKLLVTSLPGVQDAASIKFRFKKRYPFSLLTYSTTGTVRTFETPPAWSATSDATMLTGVVATYPSPSAVQTFYVRQSGNDYNPGYHRDLAWRSHARIFTNASGAATFSGTTVTRSSGSTWTADAWVNARITVTTGAAAGSMAWVSTNTTGVMTVRGWSGATPSGSQSYTMQFIQSGDTVWIGPGVYRENFTCGLTNLTSETTIAGDVTGQYTGDVPGPVIFTCLISGEWRGESSNANTLTGLVRYLTFQDLVFEGHTYALACSSSSTDTVQNITLRRCVFVDEETGAAVPVRFYTVVDAASNIMIDSCRFLGTSDSSSGLLLIQFPYSSTATYNSNITIQNCQFVGSMNYGLQIASVGTSTAFYGGGVTIRNCSFQNCNKWGLGVASAVSTTYPVTMANCAFQQVSSPISINAANFTDLGGNYQIGPAASSTNWTPSIYSRWGAISNVIAHWNPFPVEMGQSALLGRPYRPYLQPYVSGESMPVAGLVGNSAISGSPSTDINGIARPAGVSVYKDGGTASAGSTNTLTDSTKSWATSSLIGLQIRIVSGTGSGQCKLITANTSTAVTTRGNWAITPDTTSRYVIYQGPLVLTGPVSSATSTTLTDTSGTFNNSTYASFFRGFTIEIMGGTGVGQVRTVSAQSSGSNALTVSVAWDVTPDSTSRYALYWYGGSATGSGTTTSGAFELTDTAQQTSLVSDVGNGLMITGPGNQTISVLAKAQATTITIKARYDDQYGGANLPQVTLLADSYLGVSTQTATMTASADSWETLTLTCTPNRACVLRIRLNSRAGNIWGRSFFDTVSIA